MKLIIDIPEEDFERCKKRFQRRIDIMGDAIANGVPLPEHHGRIIDESKINRLYKYTEEQISYDTKVIYQIKKRTDAPTIIEAEGSGSE